MYNIIRFYNQNRKKILKVILIIASIIGLIQLLDYISAKGNNNNIKENYINNNSNISTSFSSDKSAISGQTINSSKLNEASDVIDNFIKYCNNGEIENAYNLLTKDCKEEMYPTIEMFKQNYYLRIFNETTKLYSIQNWVEDTYIVKITEDILATGKIENKSLQDYITIVEENNEIKLNINSFVGKKELNKVKEDEKLKINVISKKIFMDYEIYNINIENKSNKDILLDNKESTKTIYLQDINNKKYIAYSHEILNEDLLIKAKYTKDISIKFDNTYSSSRNIKNIVFSKIILDNEEYKNIENKLEYNNIYSLEIDI